MEYKNSHYLPQYSMQEYGYGDMLVNTDEYTADAPRGYELVQRRAHKKGHRHSKKHSRKAQTKKMGDLEFGVVRSKLGATLKPEEFHADMHTHSNEDQYKADSPAGYVVEPLAAAGGGAAATFVQIGSRSRAWPGIRPIGRSTVGAAGSREDDVDNFKVMVSENSNDSEWVSDAPLAYKNHMGFEAAVVQLKDEDDIDSMRNARQMMAQRNENTDVSAYVADAPKDYPAVASASWEHSDDVDREDVQLGSAGFFTTHGSGSYVGPDPTLTGPEQDEVDYIKESWGAHTHEEDYVADAPRTEAITFD